MGCICYCECEEKKKKKRFTLNILILILSSICVALNSISLGINNLIDQKYNIIFEIIMIVINSIVSGIQSFQLKVEKHVPRLDTDTMKKKFKKFINSIKNMQNGLLLNMELIVMEKMQIAIN